MTYDELLSALQPNASQVVTASATNITARTFGTFLAAAYGGQPIVITGATTSGDGTTVTVTGNSSYLNSPSVPVVGTFTPGTYTVNVTITYTLVGATPVTGGWTPATSFSFLPTTYNPTLRQNTAQQSSFGSMSFTNASFTVRGIGVNNFWPTVVVFVQFAGDAATSGPLAVMSWLGPYLPLSGVYNISGSGYVTPLTPGTYPWQMTGLNAPRGVLLSAALPVPPISEMTGGAITASGFVFNLYTPTDATWLGGNPTYQPVMAVTGSFTIASANQTVQLTAPVIPGSMEALLTAAFNPAPSLSGLASLLGVTGASSTQTLLSGLPPTLQTALANLGSLSLNSLTLSLQPTADGPYGVAYSYIKVTLPGVTWTPITGYVSISNLAADIFVGTPFDTPSISVSIRGTLTICTIPLSVVTDIPSFTITAEARGITLALSTFFTTYFPNSTPPASNLNIEDIYLQASPTSGSYTIAVKMASSTSWSITLGRATFNITELYMQCSGTSALPSAGVFNGTVDFGGDTELSLSMSFPPMTVSFQGQFDSVGFQQIVTTLYGPVPSWLPSGFDFTIPGTYVLIEEEGDDLVFQAATQIPNAGSFVIQVQQAGSAAGFAAGIALTGSGALASLPGLSLAPFGTTFTLQSLVLIASSFASSTFTFPPFSDFDDPAITAASVPIPTGGIVAGLNLYATMTLGSTGAQGTMASFLGITGPVSVILQVGNPPSASTQLAASTTITLAGGTLAASFGGKLSGSSVQLFLTGTWSGTVGGYRLAFSLTTSFGANGALISGSYGTNITLGGMTLSNLALQVGVSPTGGTSAGIAGTITVGSGLASVAVFWNPTNLSQSMVAGSISGGTLAGLVTAIAGATVPDSLSSLLGAISIGPSKTFSVPSSVAGSLAALDIAAVSAAFAGFAKVTLPASSTSVLVIPPSGTSATWYLTDLTTTQMTTYQLVPSGTTMTVSVNPQLYFAPQSTTIGTRTYAQGFSVSGKLTLFGVPVTVAITVTQGTGISANANFPISVRIVSSSILQLKGANGTGGPSLSLATSGTPSFQLSGQLTLLGLNLANVTLNARDYSWFAYLSGSALGMSYETTVEITSSGGIYAWFYASFTLTIPPINLSVGGVNLGTTIEISAGASCRVIVAWFPGYDEVIIHLFSTITIPIVGTLALPALTLSSLALSQLGSTILGAAKTAVHNAYTDMTHWLDAIGAGIVNFSIFDAAAEGGTREATTEDVPDLVGAALANYFQLTGAQIATAVQTDVGYDLDQIANTLYGAGQTEAEATTILTNMNQWTTAQITAAIQLYYGPA